MATLQQLEFKCLVQGHLDGTLQKICPLKKAKSGGNVEKSKQKKHADEVSKMTEINIMSQETLSDPETKKTHDMSNKIIKIKGF